MGNHNNNGYSTDDESNNNNNNSNNNNRHINNTKKSMNLCVCSHSLPAELQTLCREFHKRFAKLEGEKYDLEWKNKMKNLEVITRYQSPNKRFNVVQSNATT